MDDLLQVSTLILDKIILGSVLVRLFSNSGLEGVTMDPSFGWQRS